MFCPKCGKENLDTAEFCASCGANLKSPVVGGDDDSSVGALGLVFFCIPLVGAIMYFVWKGEKPEKAKKACNLALWGVAVGIILNIIATVIENS